jgi:hypothetical protein
MNDVETYSLDSLRDAAWQSLERGVADRTAAARHITLATASDTGAEVRIVVLRHVDQTDGVIQVHTDRLSGKVDDLTRTPHASFLIWEAAMNFQIRLRTTVTVRHGAAAKPEWDAVPEPSQGNYGGTAPGTHIGSPTDAIRGPDMARFAVLDCRIDEIETLRLGPDRHLRAVFRRSDDFAGTWLAP